MVDGLNSSLWISISFHRIQWLPLHAIISESEMETPATPLKQKTKDNKGEILGRNNSSNISIMFGFFSSPLLQECFWYHPQSCIRGTGDSFFEGVEQLVCKANHSPPSHTEVESCLQDTIRLSVAVISHEVTLYFRLTLINIYVK
jgi:hypothetical protein